MTTWQDYQPDPDDNQAAPPVGAPEGNFKGSHVNDIMRVMMSVIRKLGDAVLHLNGTTSPTADMDWGGFKITNFGKGTSRTHAARVDQIQDGTTIYGGTTTGSGSAYVATLSPLFTGTLSAGALIRAIIHTTNTTTTPTLDVGSPTGAKTIVHRNAGALQVGALRSSTAYTFLYGGTNWRVLDAGGYMEQATYDILFPVGRTLFLRTTNSPEVPAGVTATWTRRTTEQYVRIEGGTPTTGGSLTTSSTALTVNQIPSHGHNMFASATSSTALTTGSQHVASIGRIANDPNYDMASAGSTNPELGLTEEVGSGQGHTHTIEPSFRSYACWERTA